MAEASAEKRFGVIDDDQQRAMSGLEFVQGLVNGTLPLNTMARTLGYDIIEVSKGRVVAAAEPRAGTSILPALFTEALLRRCSIAAWGSLSSPCWTRALPKQHSNSRFLLCGRSPRRPGW
jgi:hypothetical protein